MGLATLAIAPGRVKRLPDVRERYQVPANADARDPP